MSNIPLVFSSLEENHKYFLKNRELFKVEYENQYVLIVNEGVTESGEDEFELARIGRRKYGEGNFYIAFCGDKPVAYISPIIRLVYAK